MKDEKDAYWKGGYAYWKGGFENQSKFIKAPKSPE